MQGRGSKFQNCLQTSFVHVSLSRRRRILDLKDDRSVRSALFSYKEAVVSALLSCKSIRALSAGTSYAVRFEQPINEASRALMK